MHRLDTKCVTEFIPDNGSGVSNSGLKDIHQGVIHQRKYPQRVNSSVSLFSIKPSACILFMYVLTTHFPDDGGDDPTAKYIVDDASSKKFLVSNFTNYKMTDSRPVLEQYNELLGILGRFTQYKMNMDEAIQDNDKPKSNNVVGPSVVNMVEHNNSSRYTDNRDKRKHHDNTRADPNKKAKPTCWKCGKTGHIKRDCKGVNVGNKANGSGTKGSVDGSSNSLKGHVYYNRMQDMSKDGLISAFGMDTKKYKTCMLTKITKPFQKVKRATEVLELIHNDLCDLHATPSLGNKKYFVTFIDDASRAVVRLPDPKLKTLSERGIECIFVGYAEHSKAFRFYVIEPNDSVSINFIIESRNVIFDENRFSSVPRPSQRSLKDGTEDIGGSVVPEEIIEEEQGMRYGYSSVEGDLRRFSDIGAWYAIEDCAQYDKKKISNPTSGISDERIANPNAQIVGDDMIRVQVPRCMAWLDYDEHVDSLSTIDNEVGVTSLESTTQTLPSFEEYTPLVTYPKEVQNTFGTPIEVEPLNETKLEEVGLNGNHNTPFSSREVPSFDGPEPQPLLNSPSLDVSLGNVIGPEPPIKPHSLDSSRMKVVDYLTTQPPSPHVANSHPKGVYSYYNPSIDDPKRQEMI
ncbi:zinc finger, CCHC-type containing protein [Tanacetum coccineum]